MSWRDFAPIGGPVAWGVVAGVGVELMGAGSDTLGPWLVLLGFGFLHLAFWLDR
jgi:hypothetical protein